MKRLPNIKDIAKQAGVSPATVSRALRGSGLVAEPTLSRVRAAAEKLSYRPNVSARNLRTRKSMSVLMVVRDVGNPFYLEILEGVEVTARAAGYSVLMGNTENDPAREAEYFDMLRDGHADGMILMTGNLPWQKDQQAEQLTDLPVVVALEAIPGAQVPHVMIDNAASSVVAVNHLIELGHRRIAHICGPIPEIMSSYRRDGYRQAMAAAGLPIPLGFEPIGDYKIGSGEVLCRALLKMEEPPTAIFVACDEMAFGAINELRRLGVDVPGDVSVVGFDDLFFSHAFYPPLTTISQPRMRIGQEAMSLLLRRLEGRSRARELIEVPTELMVRGTSAPVVR